MNLLYDSRILTQNAKKLEDKLDMKSLKNYFFIKKISKGTVMLKISSQSTFVLRHILIIQTVWSQNAKKLEDKF
jgi:hypothetical protein